MFIMSFGCLHFLREFCLLYAFLLGYLPSIFLRFFMETYWLLFAGLLIIIGIKWKTWKQTENCREKRKIPAANRKLATGELKRFWKQQKKVGIFAEKLQKRAAGEGKAVPNCPTKKPNRFKTVGHLYKTHFENRSSTLLILCDATKKRACDILYVTGSWCAGRDSNPRPSDS